MLRLRRLALLLALLFSPPVCAADVAKARAHFKAATEAFSRQAYRQAAAEYELAYDNVEDPLLLYNIALSSRLAGLWERALYRYEQYLTRVPTADNRAECEVAIRELKARLEPPPPPPPVVVAQPIAAPSSQERTLKIAGYSVGGAGLAALAVGIAFSVMATQVSDEVTAASRDGLTWDPGRDQTGRTYQGLQTGFLVAGAAAVFVGVLVLTLGQRSSLSRPYAGVLKWTF